MKSIDTLEQLLQEELRDLYDAEKQLVRALPKLAKAASAPELQEAFKQHLEVTKGHVQRLEEVFEHLGAPAKSKPCAGMRGLIEEGQEVIKEDASEHLADAALIAAAQKAEHYEIASYGTVRTFAEILGNHEVAQLLEETLNEEKEADEKLTEISKSLLEDAHRASAEGEEMEEEEPESTPKASSRAVAKTAKKRK